MIRKDFPQKVYFDIDIDKNQYNNINPDEYINKLTNSIKQL